MKEILYIAAVAVVAGLAGTLIDIRLSGGGKVRPAKLLKLFAVVFLLAFLGGWGVVFGYILPVLVVIAWVTVFFLNRKRRIRAVSIANTGVLVLLVLLFAAWGAVNLHLWWTHPGFFFSQKNRSKVYPLIQERFTRSDGEFDYAEFEKLMLAYFRALDGEEPSEPLDFDGILDIHYVYFIETLPTEKVRDLLPHLAKHQHDCDPSGAICFGDRVGYWPYRGYATCVWSVDWAYSEVLAAHKSR